MRLAMVSTITQHTRTQIDFGQGYFGIGVKFNSDGIRLSHKAGGSIVTLHGDLGLTMKKIENARFDFDTQAQISMEIGLKLH